MESRLQQTFTNEQIMEVLGITDFNGKKELAQKATITKEQLDKLDPTIYDCLMGDITKYKKKCGKDYEGPYFVTTVRNSRKYSVSMSKDGLVEFTIYDRVHTHLPAPKVAVTRFKSKEQLEDIRSKMTPEQLEAYKQKQRETKELTHLMKEGRI